MIALPPVGMGCAGIGNLYRAVDDATADATLAAALAAEIGYFDVAPHYGFGLAEERLGRALAAHDPAGRAQLSTKVGRRLVPVAPTRGERHGFVDAPPLEPVFDYSSDGVRRSFDASRKRLGRDRVDLLLAHDLGTLTHGEAASAQLRSFLDGGYAVMRALRDAGEVGAIGIGVNEIEVCDDLLDRVELDMILLAGRYTLLEQVAARPLLDRCLALGTRVVIGGPFNSGILVDGSTHAGASHFNYAPPPPDVIRRVAALERLCAGSGVPLAAAALQFPGRHPAVESVIPGLVGPEQVEAMRRFAAWPIPDALWHELSEEQATT